MEQQINIFTLGANDPDRLVDWYQEKFGWVPAKNHDGSVLFRLNGMSLLFVQESELASNVCTWPDGQGFKRFALTIGFNSEREVDRMFDELQKKGVTIVREPERVDGAGKA